MLRTPAPLIGALERTRLMVEQLLQGIGLVVVACGGLASIAYAIFKRFGERWLDAKFEERLAVYKHEQQKELEQLKFKISALLDRTTKLHQREFEILPEAWARLNEAYWKALAFVSPMQRYADLSRMSEVQFREFLSGCELDPWERDEIWQQEDRNAYYVKHVYWHRLADTKTTVCESHVYLLKNGIFLTSPVKEKFTMLDGLVWDALAG